MTLIVGIICEDGIVLAADSQTTRGTSKKSGTDKISVIKFTNGVALAAESGSASLSNNVIEAFQREAATTEILNESTVAKLAEKCVRQVRSSITSLHPGNDKPEDWQEFFQRDINYFELMLAYYFEGKPCLYTINPLWCIPVKATSYFETSGIASELANYVLKEHAQAGMDTDLASVIAVKVVEDAIEYVEGCGSPTKVAIILPQSKHRQPHFPGDALTLLEAYKEPVFVFPPEKVQEIAKIIASVERQAKTAQNKKIHKALKVQTEKIFKSITKMMEYDESERRSALIKAMPKQSKQIESKGSSLRMPRKDKSNT